MMDEVWVRGIKDEESNTRKRVREIERQAPVCKQMEPQRAWSNQGRDGGNWNRNWSARPGDEEGYTP